MAWSTPIDWTAKAIRYKVTRADMQTISDALSALAGIDLVVPGWIDAPHTWNYTGPAGFRIDGVDATSLYSYGTKLSCTDGGSTKYGYAGEAQYVGGNTLVAFIGGSAYTLSGGSITNPRFSLFATPYGFPGSFAYTPAYGGWAATPSPLDCSFSIQGRKLSAWINVIGTSAAGATTITLPVAAAAAPAAGAQFPCRVVDNGGASAEGLAVTTASSAVVTFYRDIALTAFTTSGGKAIYGAHINVPI